MANDKPKKKRITVASAKAKGRNLQKLIAEKLSELTGIPHGKDEEIQSREMGQSGTDIKLIGTAKRLLGLAIECKACEKWSLQDWIEQAVFNQNADSDEWVLIMKKSRRDPVVTISLKFFLELLSYRIKDRRNK